MLERYRDVVIQSLFLGFSALGIVSPLFLLFVGYSVHEFLHEVRNLHSSNINNNINSNINNSLITSKTFVIGSYVAVAVTVILLHLLSLMIHRLAKKCHRSPRLQTKLLYFLLGIQILSASVTGSQYIVHRRYHENIVQNIVSEAIHLMHKYNVDPSVQKAWDILQTKYHCCGFKDFSDWFVYNRPRPLESQEPIGAGDQTTMNSPISQALPDSCCDPYTSNNLCILIGRTGFNISVEYRSGCTVKMQEDVGLWLGYGSANIIICLLIEVFLIPLIIVYCQIFGDYILVSVEIPPDESLEVFKSINWNQNNGPDFLGSISSSPSLGRGGTHRRKAGGDHTKKDKKKRRRRRKHDGEIKKDKPTSRFMNRNSSNKSNFVRIDPRRYSRQINPWFRSEVVTGEDFDESMGRRNDSREAKHDHICRVEMNEQGSFKSKKDSILCERMSAEKKLFKERRGGKYRILNNSNISPSVKSETEGTESFNEAGYQERLKITTESERDETDETENEAGSEGRDEKETIETTAEDEVWALGGGDARNDDKIESQNQVQDSEEQISSRKNSDETKTVETDVQIDANKMFSKLESIDASTPVDASVDVPEEINGDHREVPTVINEEEMIVIPRRNSRTSAPVSVSGPTAPGVVSFVQPAPRGHVGGVGKSSLEREVSEEANKKDSKDEEGAREYGEKNEDKYEKEITKGDVEKLKGTRGERKINKKRKSTRKNKYKKTKHRRKSKIKKARRGKEDERVDGRMESRRRQKKIGSEEGRGEGEMDRSSRRSKPQNENKDEKEKKKRSESKTDKKRTKIDSKHKNKNQSLGGERSQDKGSRSRRRRRELKKGGKRSRVGRRSRQTIRGKNEERGRGRRKIENDKETSRETNAVEGTRTRSDASELKGNINEKRKLAKMKSDKFADNERRRVYGEKLKNYDKRRTRKKTVKKTKSRKIIGKRRKRRAGSMIKRNVRR